MLSGRGLCDELINRPEESYRLLCVVVCDLETSRMGAPYIYIYIYIYDISRLRVNSIGCTLQHFENCDKKNTILLVISGHQGKKKTIYNPDYLYEVYWQLFIFFIDFLQD